MQYICPILLCQRGFMGLDQITLKRRLQRFFLLVNLLVALVSVYVLSNKESN